jgi:hypothetical protein
MKYFSAKEERSIEQRADENLQHSQGTRKYYTQLLFQHLKRNLHSNHIESLSSKLANECAS